MANVQNIVLGSGKLYIGELLSDGKIPDDIVSEANHVGDISGGAELIYRPSVCEVENDDGIVRKTFLTKEEVIFKSGILTWALDNIEKMCAGGTYDSSTNTLAIGGKKSMKQYAIAFVHEADFATIQVLLIGSNRSGFQIRFDKSKETVIDATFTALPSSEGTLVKIRQINKS